MYQDTIKQLEEVVANKDRIIGDHLVTIAKLTEGNVQELSDIKLMFFSKQKDLVKQISDQRAKFKKQNEKFVKEIATWEQIEKKQKVEIESMKEEILMAKKILKDPNLCTLASRKFNNTIDKTDDRKFIVKGAVVTGLLPQEEDEMKMFECEMEKPNKKLLPGYEMKKNVDLPASELTL